MPEVVESLDNVDSLVPGESLDKVVGKSFVVDGVMAGNDVVVAPGRGKGVICP
jgi:hypothetical protein